MTELDSWIFENPIWKESIVAGLMLTFNYVNYLQEDKDEGIPEELNWDQIGPGIERSYDDVHKEIAQRMRIPINTYLKALPIFEKYIHKLPQKLLTKEEEAAERAAQEAQNVFEEKAEMAEKINEMIAALNEMKREWKQRLVSFKR